MSFKVKDFPLFRHLSHLGKRFIWFGCLWNFGKGISYLLKFKIFQESMSPGPTARWGMALAFHDWCLKNPRSAPVGLWAFGGYGCRKTKFRSEKNNKEKLVCQLYIMQPFQKAALSEKLSANWRKPAQHRRSQFKSFRQSRRHFWMLHLQVEWTKYCRWLYGRRGLRWFWWTFINGLLFVWRIKSG